MLMGPTLSLLSTLNMSTCIIPWELVNATMKLVNLGLQVLSYFLFLFKSLPQEFVKLKIWQCSLLLIVVSCLFEFCRETSPSLVSGVILLPHFSQSQANP